MSEAITLEELGPTLGAEVGDVDSDRLLHDPAVPGAVLAALDRHGVLVFPEVGLDDASLVAFGRRLGDLVSRRGQPIPEVNVITQGPDNPLAEYLKGNAQWHIDGAHDEVPAKAGILAAHLASPGDSGTEYASSYAAYDELTDDEKELVSDLRVIHSMEASLRQVYPDPTPDQLATWRRMPPREHPLVWRHDSGRSSLVLGHSADHVVGLDRDEGRALLADLLERATRPDRIVHHDWNLGDIVIWDNTGVLHRVSGHDPTSDRELHRVTLAGDEPIH